MNKGNLTGFAVQYVNREDIIYMIQETIFIHPNEKPFDFQLKRLDQIEYFASLIIDHQKKKRGNMK